MDRKTRKQSMNGDLNKSFLGNGTGRASQAQKHRRELLIAMTSPYPKMNDKGRVADLLSTVGVELCKPHIKPAIDFLAKVLNDESEDTRCRLVAAKELLDRGLGRPVTVEELAVAIERITNMERMRAADALSELTLEETTREERESIRQVVEAVLIRSVSTNTP